MFSRIVSITAMISPSTSNYLCKWF